MTIAQNEDLDLHVVEIDVVDDASVAAGVAEAERIAGGALDVVVNNAGIGVGGPAELSDMEVTKLIFETNLYGYMRVANAALPNMREKGAGQIFNVSSQLGRFVIPGLSLYCATKFGLEAMFETMAYELAPTGVEITIIQPGGYPTKIWDNGVRYTDEWMARVSDDKKAAYETHIAMARGMMGGRSYSTNPIDVPNAIAEIMAMPAGKRPLRRVVHPRPDAAAGANAALAQVQAGVLGQGSFASWHEAVTD
jgi:NAD(P)-dependent dehydrogenase (short-subunit alcohol dehydrogenase family)